MEKVILGVVAVAALGGAGWYFYKRSKSNGDGKEPNPGAAAANNANAGPPVAPSPPPAPAPEKAGLDKATAMLLGITAVSGAVISDPAFAETVKSGASLAGSAVMSFLDSL